MNSSTYIKAESQACTMIKHNDDSRFICKIYHVDEDYPELIRVIQNSINEFYFNKKMKVNGR
jgi:hypothetical protein